MISMIAAHDLNNLIGKDNKLPWHIPEDLDFFKETTLNKKVVMGKNTFDSILSYLKKPLPKRESLVLTRNTDFKYEGVQVYNKIDDILKEFINSEEEIVIIGGEQIYKAFLPYVNKLYVTVVNSEFEGDSWFPEYKSYFSKKQSLKKGSTDKVSYEMFLFEK